MVKTALCKQVSKSVSLLGQWDKICNSLFELLCLGCEKHEVNLHCHQNLKVVSRQEKKVVLKPRSISDVNLPEVTYHAQILDILVWSFLFFSFPRPWHSVTLCFSNLLEVRCSGREFMTSRQWNAFFITITVDFLDTGSTSIFKSFWKLTIISKLIVRVVGICKTHQFLF